MENKNSIDDLYLDDVDLEGLIKLERRVNKKIEIKKKELRIKEIEDEIRMLKEVDTKSEYLEQEEERFSYNNR